ncbi:type II secretion system F family protein [Azospirillum sp.]|uniref:type II secretion system F family protein n=1 Tax=Azospirillum sp. TaxID=34012 RepID=UPI002D29FA65|nr:type II secretion system F family protein [Azospirillum sp.]HYD64562.1 type II secretion system F family protein [Azospirillum sp.]
MVESFFAFLTDPASMIVLVASLSAFLTVMALILPYVRSDPLAGRLKTVSRHRHALRAQQMEALQRKSRLRRDRPSPLKTLVERLKLRDLFAGEDLRTRLVQANWRGPNAVALFVTARALAPLAFAGVAGFLLFGSNTFTLKPQVKVAITFGAVVVGVYLPNLLMSNAIQKRQQTFAEALPDALDLLLICVEAGLSIEAAFGRVAQEIGASSPALAQELELTTAELAYLPERRQALENLALRTGLPAVKAVTTTLIQAEKYGTPLASALRTAAQESRDRRMAAAEKKAGSLPARLTVPMIVFFLPVLFVVILGPAIIQITSR